MENNLLLFLLSTVLISLSGVMSPGPMTAAVIQLGTNEKYSGIFLSLGHGLVEVPLIISIFLGASNILQLESIRIFIGITGGILLFIIGLSLIRFKKRENKILNKNNFSPFYSGVILSAGNPYFILWWTTVGTGLIINANKFGYVGLFLFIVFHWVCDLIWYSILSMASYKGARIFGESLYNKVSIICGIFMFFFSGMFIYSSLKLIML